MDNVNLTIDGQKVSVPAGTTILEAARTININIPSLCYLRGVNAIGSCRVCVVDAGARSLTAACVMPVSEGMVVKTNTEKVRTARRTNLELLLSNHDRECLSCVRNRSCELQRLSEELGVRDIPFKGEKVAWPIDTSSVSVERDPNKCILCRRCVATCHNVQKVGVIGATNRGFKTIIEPAFSKSLGDVTCINCGQCIIACPTGALREKDDTKKVWAAINDPDKVVIAQCAPAVRVGLGEEFDLPMGTRVTGKLAAAMRRVGFDKTFDTNFAADMTIVEEATELIDRITNGGVLPMFTSCSPGWIKYCEHNHPEFLPHLSSCKSPHQMLGAVLKSYYAQKHGIDPAKIVIVSIMPCTAKKFEAQRPEMANKDGLFDVDVVITTREFARMIRESGIDFANLPDEAFDEFFGDSTGAGAIFGATGGVMEAALRTAADVLTGTDVQAIEYTAVRGIAGIKEATVKIGDLDVKVAVANSTGAAEKLIQKVQSGEAQYHFCEVMACPGGCVTGGGQPIVDARRKLEIDPRVARAQAIYAEDEALPLRKSHENPSLKKLYDEYFDGKYGSHKAHEELHVHGYTPRAKY